jgi:hypothetical protein
MTGCYNQAIGWLAGYNNTGGTGNVSIGFKALSNLFGGACNVAIGWCAGYGLTSGSNNVMIGNIAVASAASMSNQITIGNATMTTQRAALATWTALSDSRDKTGVENIPVGLQFTRELRPVKYKWHLRDTDETHPRYMMPDSGFLAQELLETANKYNANEWLRVATHSDPDQYMADPGKLIPVLVKSVQELADQVDTLTAKVQTLEEKVQQLGG